MKRFMIVCAIVLAAVACAPKEQPADRLVVDGTQLTLNGQPVAFRGLSFGWHNLWPRFYNASCLRNLAWQGNCRLFRAAIGADDLDEMLNGTTDHPGYISDPEQALTCLYNVVDAAVENKCYVIVDWHSHVLHTEEARDFFTKVATRYADCPYVIYELFNEPVSRAFESEHSYADLGDADAMKAYWGDLKAYAETLIETITSISTVHPLILMGSPCWDQRIDLPAADPIKTYDNLMYTLHFYAATHKESLRDAASAALAAGLPLFISECAACEASGDGPMDLDQWRYWNTWASDNGVSMVAWSISDKNETCSMAKPEASSEGPWDFDIVKPWGEVVFNWL